MESIKEPESVSVKDGQVFFTCPWSGALESHPNREGETEWLVTARCCVTSEEEASDAESGVSILRTRIILQ